MSAKPANESNFHHFVPKSVLRRFTVDGAGKQIWVLDKKTGRSFYSGLKKTGSGQGYNTMVLPDGVVWNFEDEFKEIDDEFGATGNILASKRRVADLDPDFRDALCVGVAVQFLRTPLVRTSLEALMPELSRRMEEKGLPPIDQPMPTDNDVRASTLRLIAKRDELAKGLLSKIPVLFEPAGEAWFWTSDHPIVRESTVPDRQLGFKNVGTCVFAPIASDLMLGLICPSVLTKLTSLPLERLDMEAGKKARLIRLRDGLLSGKPIQSPDDEVGDFNQRQLSGSERFVYACGDFFAEAKAWLKANPHRRTGERLMQVGAMGEAPPRPPEFSEGQWLLVHGKTNWESLPIGGYDPNRKLRIAWTDRPDLLQLAMRHAPLVQAQIYFPEGEEMIRDVKIVILERGPRTRFKIVPSDPGMAALDTMLRAGGS